MPGQEEAAKQQYLLSLFHDQGSDHAVILMDARGIIVGWLAGAERIFGFPADHIVGQPLSRLFTPEDVQRGIPDHELEVARRDGKSEDDRWHLRDDGLRFWVSGVVIALRNEANEIVGFGKFLRDRTDLKGQIETLENRCEALAKADQRKDIFLATLAHELRNPLAPLSNAVQLIQLVAPQDSKLAYPVKLIERQVEFIRRLVDDLLDVTRIGAGKIQLQIEPVQLHEVLVRAVESCQPKAQVRCQQLQLLIPAVPIAMDADPARLEQIVINLVTNAIKYTSEGGHIWVKATVEEEEAVVRVEDTGIGISAELLPRIFDLFTQDENSRHRSEGGLGIGLSIVKDLVTLHGGSIQVRSEGKDKGSKFTVRLPLKQPIQAKQPSGSPIPGPWA